jgi:hypothetical protein
MKDLLFIAALFFTFGCQQSPSDEAVQNAVVTEKKFASDNPFSNPAIFQGSSFGHFFQSLLRTGQYATMLRFTSRSTRIKFGDERLLEYYQEEMQFGYVLGKLKAVTGDDTLLLIYPESYLQATRKIVQLKVLSEQDTCKLILERLSPEPF